MKHLFSACLLFSSLFCLAQKEVSNWYFGEYASLNFNCSPIKSGTANPDFTQLEGCSSISDSLGNLLFYTNGLMVYDSHDQLMPNGFDIGMDSSCGGSSTQGALIVKQPGQDSLYYIFTTDCAENLLAKGFRYSIVNMHKHGGLGDVVVKSQLLVNKVCEKLAAVQQSNNTGAWILVHGWGDQKFYAFRLNTGGLNPVPVISTTGRIQLPLVPNTSPDECAARGYMKFSPQGNRVVVVSTSDCHLFTSYPELFSFNNISGAVSYNYSINTMDSINYYGASFSPSGNLLYLSQGWYGYGLYQFDLSSNDSSIIAASRYIVTDSSTTIRCALQIGPDGRIYNANSSPSLNIIKNPNVYGPGCNFVENGISLNNCVPAMSIYGLPNNDESFYLSSFTGSPCPEIRDGDFGYLDSCICAPVYFYDSTDFGTEIPNTWAWSFGDPITGTNNLSSLQNPHHSFSTPGTYNVKLIVSYIPGTVICKSDTVIKPIHVVTSADDLSNGQFISIYPNPAIDQVEVSSAFPVYEAEVRNMLGQTLEQLKDKDIKTIPLNLPKGSYILTLTTEKGRVNKRILIVER
ncbi:MAG: T9SS type A sorting domain-containing protein [Bacteroidia bacterium]